MKNIMPIQVLNKKLYPCSLLLILCVTLPLNSMLTSKTFGRLKQMQQKAAQKRSFGLSQRPMNINIKPTMPQSTEIKQPSFFSWFSEIANSWWNSPPLEEKLSTWSTNVGTTIKTAATNLSANIQSKQIIYKLRIDQYVSDSSSETIQAFLKNNKSDDIKDVFNETIKYLGGDHQLIKMCANNPSIAIKILPAIQEALPNPKLITTPASKIPYESQNILRLTSKVLLQLSHSTNSAQTHTINEIKKQLLQILIAHPFYIIYINTTVLLTILPDDIDDFITIIKKWETQIEFDVSGTGEMERINSQSFSYGISNLLLQRVINEKDEKNREKLCTFIVEKPYANQIIQKITPDSANAIANIIQALEKKFLPDNISNLYLFIPDVLNLASQSNPSLAMNIVNEIILTLQKKMLTNEIYTNNFRLLTEDILKFTSKNNPLLAKNFINELADILKNKLLTNDKFYDPKNIYLLIENVLTFTSKNNPSVAKDLTDTITAQFNNLSSSPTGTNLLINTLPTDEIISTLQKKMLTNEIYTNNFRLLTKEILNTTSQNNLLTIKNFIYELTNILKNKLVTDDLQPDTINSKNIYLLAADILNWSLKKDPSLAKDFANSITAQFKKISKSPTGLNLLTIILSTSEIIQRTLNLNNEYTETPSYKHLEKYASAVAQTFSHIFRNPNFITMIQNALKKEKELNDLGYETFYHARRWKYGLLSDIYNMLFEYKSGEKLNDFMFTHLDDPALPISGKKINPLFFKSEKAKQALLLKKGNYSEDPIGIAGYETLLFLNKFLFGNTTRLGECSIHYMINNSNITDIKLSISEIFAMFGDSVVYNTYEQQLQELEREYAKLSNYGELLLIAVPRDKIKDYVYYTVYGGAADDGQRKSLNIPGVGETFDIEKILEYQNKNPQDTGIYNLINTKTAGLNPKSGIKIFPFNAADPDKMKAFKEKENALFAEIVQSMKEKDSKKEMEAASRE